MKKEENYTSVRRIRFRKSAANINEALRNMRITMCKKRNLKQEGMDDNVAKVLAVDALLTEENMARTINRLNLIGLKQLMKVCKEKKKEEQAMGMSVLGLDVRRIEGNPSYRKESHSKCQGEQRKASTMERDGEIIRSHRSAIEENTIPEDSQRKYSCVGRRDQEGKSEEINKLWSLMSGRKKVSNYLYKRMQGSERNSREIVNEVYEKRITSYTDFLWKMQFSHNFYINLDLADVVTKIRKLKAFVGYGNNCNMIKGLLKRRFWWTIAEDMAEDCAFVWTQIKIQGVYDRQPTALQALPQPSKEEDIQRAKQTTMCSQQIRRKTQCSAKLPSPRSQNKKILNSLDYQLHMRYLRRVCKTRKFSQFESESVCKPCYRDRALLVNRHFKKITLLKGNSDDAAPSQPIVHNHLENNFYLGNKKALFYNLQEYYSLTGQDLFTVVPLTFHIKRGLEDVQYARFVGFYKQRMKLIKREEKLEEEGHQQPRRKTRNIWIVKPGENSNQGKGITVIDEIYELNAIIKASQNKEARRSGSKISPSSSVAEPLKTFIVQMYIDRPLLYNQRKFDIRHYMLITSLHGTMRAYWYDEGYIRTSAYHFNIHDFEPEIHLTNDAVQKLYPDYGRYEPYNKLSYSELQNYMCQSESSISFKRHILPQMRKMAQDAARSVYLKVSQLNRMHNFEIFGLDFMIDSKRKPWLIEINTNPCLDVSCPLLDKIIPYMVQQSLKLSLDVIFPPPSHYPNTAKHYAPYVDLKTFKFQLIFDSQTDGAGLKQLYRKRPNNSSRNWAQDIGDIEQDQQFKDNGTEIRLEDYS